MIISYYVYVLYSKKLDKFYIGYAKHLKERLIEHKTGNIYTTYRMPDLKLVYYEVCLLKQDAIARERQLKTGYGRQYLRNRLKNYLININEGV